KSKGTSKEVCGYPLSIFFIVVNEFCERFSYYGMRAVLVLYFKYFLRWDNDLATSIYHTFVALCYLTPILGAIVADSWLGKFKTIIYLSIVYAIGQVLMAVTGSFHHIFLHALSMVGLFLIALGTGGIKPCVAAFGGDQFSDSQDKQRRTFFSVFYLCINGGSLLAINLSCYSLAFGVPAALMVVALVVFIVGSGMYYKAEPQGNIMLDVCKCIGFAIKNRYRHRSSQYPKKEHWMDWAEDKYEKLLIAQIKMVLKVLFLYIPLPMFWTLFDQKGSRWTLQATTMDGNFGLLVIQPDQMQTVNPILILTLVPIMDSLIYPLIQKCGLNFTPLKRMTVGMLLAAIAFICAAVVQIEIDVSRKQLLCLYTLKCTKVHGFIYVKYNSINIEPPFYFYVQIDNVFKYCHLSKISLPSFESQCPKLNCNYLYLFQCQESITVAEDIKPNSAHMALQIPQYFFITAGEVMFSVTGLEFSYSQAPNNMKAVLQAGWLFTVAIGNFIVLIVAELAKLPEQWAEYILFASLLIAVCFIFSIMAYFYTYIDPAEIEAQFKKKLNADDEDDKSKLQKTEVEMVRKDSNKSHDEDDPAKQTKM
uniref:Solute carrier family 15 member 1a n=1 Tax=Dicentrarchus labrax TaxID=13489 RepID=A0A8C4F2F7_DICLA